MRLAATSAKSAKNRSLAFWLVSRDLKNQTALTARPLTTSRLRISASKVKRMVNVRRRLLAASSGPTPATGGSRDDAESCTAARIRADVVTSCLSSIVLTNPLWTFSGVFRKFFGADRQDAYNIASSRRPDWR